MPVQDGFVTILVTEETRRWLRLLAAMEDKPIYTIVSALVAEAVNDSPVCTLICTVNN